MLTAILSAANQDQNMAYPPWIYSAHYNIATSFVISLCVERYPDNEELIDIIQPFVNTKFITVEKGHIPLDADYRDLLGTPSISVAVKEDCECSEPITSSQQFQVAIMKGRCRKRPIVILPRSEFDYRTTSLYNFPTHTNPVGYFSSVIKDDGSSVNSIKVCPYDLTRAEIMYVIQEPVFKFGYTMQPDDTYLFDPSTSTESTWTSAAFEALFKAMISLYGAYTRDPTISNWSQILNKENIL